MNYAKWIEYFTRNKQNRPEPDWAAPLNLPPGVLAPVLRSVEQFRLGDGGGPASLIAHDAERFRGRTEELRRIVDLWFKEEAKGKHMVKTVWFKRWGWFHVPASWPGAILLLGVLACCAQVFWAIDRSSHSVSDTLYGVFPFFACGFLLLDWVATRTSHDHH